MPLFDKEKKQKEQLETIEKREAEELAKILAKRYDVPYANLYTVSVDLDGVRLIDEEEARNTGMIVVRRAGKNLKVAVKNPQLPATKAIIKKLEDQHYKVGVFLASLPGLEYAWKTYSEVLPESKTTEGMIVIQKSQLEDLKKRLIKFENLAVLIQEMVVRGDQLDTTELIQLILAGGFQLDASDIHLEVQEKKTLLRLRLDGVLHKITTVTPDIYALLLSRIKLLSGLKLNIHNRAQDGRFTIRAADVDVEIRTSALPGAGGESIVMRILNPKTIGLTMEDLGMQPLVYKTISHEIKKPNGMILTTGPTGSGKTTTLYAFVKKLNSPEIKIITLENPIEYHLEGVVQTQVSREGEYTFDKGLQAILRQDPDVILVGEIRNIQTASAALQAANTGHLVFSTLHTNNAPATIPRLIDIGAKPNVIAPAVNAVIAQRLLRRLCKNCKYQYTLSAEELNYVRRIIVDMPKDYSAPDLRGARFWKAKGCDVCNSIGYKGRIGIYELFLIDDTIGRLIYKNPSDAEVREAAKAQGMLSLHQDGILKAIDGVTSIEELLRVAGEI